MTRRIGWGVRPATGQDDRARGELAAKTGWPRCPALELPRICGVVTLAATLLVVGQRPSLAQKGSGALGGAVTLAPEASIPAPTLVQNTTDPAECGELHSVEEVVVDPDSRGVRHAIVSLSGVPAENVPTQEPPKLVIDNRNCRFDPHASVMTVGGTIEALNSDDILHTVHLYGPIEANLGLPIQYMRRSQQIDQPGLFVVKCDVHGWMQAYVRVDPHPFHAVTDGQGAFRIEGVPAGNYTLEIWHESIGTTERKVAITPGGIEIVSVELGRAEQTN